MIINIPLCKDVTKKELLCSLYFHILEEYDILKGKKCFLTTETTRNI